ncbi:hypothetical protein F5Y15DRAFT_415108 [Xylariaceae sp. FL0016]|nr:hypothetical protein F5Y15DRAFT_415108 [Xylariaceae sp. FL0016]
MYRTAVRSTPRIATALRQTTGLRAAGRRFASTSPADKKRSWKNSTLRWGLAVGAVYWYTTSATFAEEPHSKTISPPPQFSDEDLPTVEAVVAQKRKEAEARLQETAAESTADPETAPLATSASAPAHDEETGRVPAPEGSPEALEEEAGQQGAFNPETGEINWDCPCLGGMAHGPCGEEFKAAFSCFVYSKEEPKGMDCIDKFQGMQDCFRQHPDIYGSEIDDEEADMDADNVATREAAPEAPIGDNKSESSQPVDAPKPVEASPAEPQSDREAGETLPDRARDATVPPSPKP